MAGLDFDIGFSGAGASEPLLPLNQQVTSPWTLSHENMAAARTRLAKDLALFQEFITKPDEERTQILGSIEVIGRTNNNFLTRIDFAAFKFLELTSRMSPPIREDNDIDRANRLWSFEYFNIVVLHYWYSKRYGVLIEDIDSLVKDVETWSASGNIPYVPEWFKKTCFEKEYSLTSPALLNLYRNEIAARGNVTRKNTFFATFKYPVEEIPSGKIFDDKYASIYDMCMLRPTTEEDAVPKWKKENLLDNKPAWKGGMTPVENQTSELAKTFTFAQLRDIFWIQSLKGRNLNPFLDARRYETKRWFRQPTFTEVFIPPKGATLGYNYKMWKELEKIQRSQGGRVWYVPPPQLRKSEPSSTQGSDPWEGCFECFGLLFCCGICFGS